MVNSMCQEMEHNEKRPIREHFVDVEQKPMQTILEDSPYEVARKEAQERLDECIDWDARERRQRKGRVDGESRKRPSKLEEGPEEEVGGYGSPYHWDNVPLRDSEELTRYMRLCRMHNEVRTSKISDPNRRAEYDK
jgi:hypothetical protein